MTSIDTFALVLKKALIRGGKQLPEFACAELASWFVPNDFAGAALRMMSGDVVVKYENKSREVIFKNGLIDSFIGNPTQVTIKGNKIRAIWLNAKGKLHREDGPAVIAYVNGIIRYRGWYYNGKLHNERGHASCLFHPEGAIAHKIGWYHGVLHNKDIYGSNDFRSYDQRFLMMLKYRRGHLQPSAQMLTFGERDENGERQFTGGYELEDWHVDFLKRKFHRVNVERFIHLYLEN